MFSEVRKGARKAGQPPGTPTYTGTSHGKPPSLTVITYDKNSCHKKVGATLADCLHEKSKNGTTWVSIEGLHDIKLIEQVAKHFQLHPLTVEDILNVEQRPKIEEFDNYIFITLKVLHWTEKSSTFSVKQISLIFGENFLLSFQELDTSLFDALSTRLQSDPNQRLREQGSDYLAYRLIDTIIDQYFIVLEALGEKIEDVEQQIIDDPEQKNSRSIYRLKRQILVLRKAIWPIREAISHLLHTEEKYVSAFTRVYLRDVYDHTVQAIDTVETFRDMISGMIDMYLSSLTNRMNEIMKTLTIITTIFIPITAIASVYGMNFTYIPGLDWRYGYSTALGSMVLIAITMLFYFKKKKWI